MEVSPVSMQKALTSQLLAEDRLCRTGGEALLALSHATVPMAGDDPPQLFAAAIFTCPKQITLKMQ